MTQSRAFHGRRLWTAVPLVMLFCAGLIAGSWAVALQRISEERAEAVAGAQRRNANLTLAFQEHTLSTLRSLERSLRYLQREFQDRGLKGFQRAREELVLPDPNLIHLSIADAAGRVLSEDGRPSGVSVAGMEHFARQAERRDGALRIGETHVSRMAGVPVIPVTVSLAGKDGEFAGVMMAGLSPKVFTDFFRQMNLGPQGLVGLIGLDGIDRVRYASGELSSGQDVRQSSLFQALSKERIGNFLSSARSDGVVRHMSFRRLVDYPLVVVVGVGAEDVLAEVSQGERAYLAFAALWSVFAVLFGWALIFAVRRENALLVRREAQLTAVQRLASSEALEDGDLNLLAPQVTEAAAKVIGAARANLWVFNEEESELRCLDLFEAPAGRHSAGMVVKEAQYRSEFEAVKNTSFIAADDALSDPRLAGYVDRYLKPLGISSILDAVIVVSGRHLGLLCIEYVGARHRWTPDEITFACQLADKIAVAITNSARRKAQDALHASHTLLMTTERLAAIGGWEWDVLQDRMQWSDQTYRILGRSQDSPVRMSDFLAAVHPDDCPLIKAVITASLSGEQVYDVKFRILRPDGTEGIGHVQGQVVRDEQSRPVRMTGTLHDITELKRAEEQLLYQAQHDALTDLPNRLLFTDRLNMALSQAERSGKSVALLFMDLDRFKNINDSLGHVFGDRLLREVAARLKACIRAADTVSRQGGDEFLVVLPELDDTEDAGRVAEKLVAATAQPFKLGQAEVVMTVSIGVACSPDNGKDAETLLRNADAALHFSKQMGRNRYQFYSAEMNARTKERLVLEGDLRRALEQEQMFLVYQPQVELARRNVIGLEALVRWHHPTRGVVMPSQFVSIAEDSGLIAPMGTWVLENACRQHAHWVAQGLISGTIAVNVSAHQFRQPDFVGLVAAVLSQSGLRPELLEIELTESVVMHGVDQVLSKLRALAKLGVKLTIDDFGTGYSSLSYLKQFPIHRLKIDQSFTRGLPDDRESGAIAEAVINMGHSLGLNVLAEGIETRAQEEYLQALSCDAGQGYFYAKPLTVARLTEYLRLRSKQRRTAEQPTGTD